MKSNLLITFSLFTVLSFSQDKSDKIVTVGYDACECIGEINTELDYDEKSKLIKECITSANMSYQLLNKLTVVNEKLKDTISSTIVNRKSDTAIDSINVASNKIDISINSNEDFQEIEDYLLETCGDLKTIYFSNDKETSRKSVSNKKEAKAFYDLGTVASENQDYELAIDYYKKALAIDKKFAFAWDNLGYTYRRLNRLEEAVAAYKKSLKIDPKGKTPLMNIGVAFEKLGEFDNAIKYYKKYTKYHKKDPEGFYGLGRMHFEKRDFEPAVDNMMKAYLLYIEIESPYKKDAEANLGIMYRVMEEAGKLDIFRAVAKKNKINLGN